MKVYCSKNSLTPENLNYNDTKELINNNNNFYQANMMTNFDYYENNS